MLVDARWVVGLERRGEDVGGCRRKTYVPGWSAVEGLGGVVVSFAVAAYEEQFVDCVAWGPSVQVVD